MQMINANEFEKWAWSNPDIVVDGDGYVSPYAVSNFALDHAIEAEPVRHGRWMLKERAHYFKCSLCNEPIPYKFGYSESRRYYNYCPRCGANMDGGAE